MTMVSYHRILNTLPCQCTIDRRAEVLRRLGLLVDASPFTFDTVTRLLQSGGLATGEEVSPYLFSKGVFGIVANGAFKVQRWIDEQSFVVVDILTEGDFFLYAPSAGHGPSMYTYPPVIQSLTTSCLLRMDLARFVPLLSGDPALFEVFFRQITSRISDLTEHLVHLMGYDAEHRIAWLLLFLYDKAHRRSRFPNLIPFNLTRKDLASMAGLTLETTSRIIASFEREGCIKSGRGWVTIVDRTSLQERASVEAW